MLKPTRLEVHPAAAEVHVRAVPINHERADARRFSCCRRVQQRAQQLRVDARVVVQEQDPLVSGSVEPDVIPPAKPAIAILAQHPRAWIMPLNDLGRIDRRRVVHYDHLNLLARVIERRQRIQTRGQMRRPKSGHDHNRHSRRT